MAERPYTTDRRELEDMSSIGMDWDNETMETGAMTNNEQPSVATGDIDADDLEADEQRYLEKHALVVDGFRCPEEFVKILTPMEFEEIVNLFTKFDVDHSGTIDKHETKKVLQYLGMEGSMDMANELIDIIDIDKSGEIDFQEFCNFIVMLKRGDPRLQGYSSMLSVLNSTPLGELERQASSRGLSIRFVIIEKREATLTQPTNWIVEVQVSGIYHTLVDGDIVPKQLTKKFQGMAQTTKDAKYAAASSALLSLGEAMPGVRCKEGEFPDEWLEWLNENLLRGVDAGKIVGILASKGFHPHKNATLMHRILTWCSLDRFILLHPEVDLHDPGAKLHEDFFEWVKETALRGIDGEVIMQVLDDRCVDLRKDNLHFAQQLQGNELGSLKDKNGQDPDILDFWHACKNGYYDDVVIYCKCGVAVNEMKFDRHTSERISPLMYAAGGGHAEVVKVLLSYGADPKAVDLRGRGACHYAALKGHTACCAYLVEGGAMMFAGDIQKNTPLHLAAMNNHLECVNYLAFKALDVTRMMTSDKIKVKKNQNFLELSEEVFKMLPGLKLTSSDTVRVEKTWLHDAANLFISKMDKDVIHMLAPSCEEIMEDVLARFDPRPESGIYLTSGVNGEQMFLKTVPTGADLSVLLKNMFRQSALDTINNWKRTPLHMACDANHINSHEALILRMIDFHGCNVTMKDIHGRRPIDLLIKDKVLQNMPTSTQVREELLIDRRAIELERLFKNYDDIDFQRTQARRRAVLDECIEANSLMSPRLWDCLREAALFSKQYGKHWEKYEDPDTGNYFYCKVPANPMMGDTYTEYGWEEPASAKCLIDRTNAMFYLLRVRSTLLRQYGEWETYRCKKTGIDIYYNLTNNDITFVTPKDLAWRAVVRDATNTKERLGYGKEWEVFTDKHGVTFYRNAITKQCEYDRPHDAVNVKPAEMLCSAYQHKGKATVQNWYSCEQCNRAWKSSPEGSAAAVKICEPCVVRCHYGHKGVRLIRNSQALCICASVCKVTNCACNALVISKSQTRVQTQAIAIREELERQRQRNVDSPPIFAVVPRRYNDGSPKLESGWTICRVCTSSDASTGGRTKDDGSLMLGKHGDDASLEEAEVSDSEGSLGSKSVDSLGSASVASLDAESQASKGNRSRASKGGSVSFSVGTSIKSEKNALSLLPAGSMRIGLPPNWVEVFDCEEPLRLKYEDRVLVRRYGSELKKLGTIKQETRRDFYKIRYDDRTLPDEVVARSYLELISRPKFYCNPLSGQSAWSMFQAQSSPIESEALTLNGIEWMDFYEKSIFRRPFGPYAEMLNPYVDQVFYMHQDTFTAEKAALQLQTLFRTKSCKPRPIAPWMSKTFTFDPPEHVRHAQVEWAGWAYFRRRSISVGEFLDVEGNEWEEYTDKKTSEYFYWCEESNLYQWDKPEVFQRKTDARELLKVGEDVMYVFPGRRQEEMAVITKVRFDDETGEDMYDLVHKYVPDMAFKWIARMHIKFVPKEGDALMLAKLEVKWKVQLRRKRESDERKAKRDKELAQAAELKRLEDMKSMAYRLGKREESAVSTNTRLARGRVKRLELEAQEIREHIDRTEGKERRDRIAEIVKTMRAERNMTRAEVLSVTRALEMKMKIEDTIAARNRLRKELVAKKKESIDRTLYIEETLREGEIRTTTPRSLVRRRIVRRMHIAMQRQKNNFMICEWGCGDWFRVGKEQIDHQLRRCVRRIIGCALGCPLKHTEEYWLSPHESSQCFEIKTGSIAESSMSSKATSFDSQKKIFYGGSVADRARTPDVEGLTVGVVTIQQYHETDECPKRPVMCPKNCLEWVVAEVLEKHLTEQCTKRPAKPISCRQGCGAKFGGQVETLIQAEDERLQHETEECPFRTVRCTWQFDDGRICAAQMRADEREEHRDYHLTLQGMMTYVVPGTYLYKVPKKLTRLKVQLWGGGGGSGFFKGRQGGCGGGGAYVEAIIAVEPFSVLELVVGAGGGGGVCGTELQTVDITEQRRRMALRRDKEVHLLKGEKMVHRDDDEYAVALLMEESCGVTPGGAPGGGEGNGGSGCWASGGGGGYSMISKKSVRGNQALLVAAGGGGGASLNGLPGGALEGVLAGTLLDPINGQTATVDTPGKGGESGSTYNAAWNATPGAAWQGGNGCEFGAGGGGGYFGGGGGGTSPGISGGGGGGSSYIYLNIAYDSVMVMGHGMQPGGLNHNPPLACGLGEWDKVGGFAGQGGVGDPNITRPGNNGAIRLTKPGHY